ncbi:Methionine ABC transporter ATP-binding protein [Cystobacter fuscus DSM 2262]|uniref:Cell division ATP-binding protein FtsE n=1 Tax=Cystobacter fuscus (strain ATCC 25194 / DSM 2262 / NBRC 100088 / M29) TaxID=1242864 RepID=S9Q498_CYSF2|nr:ATP-binding cassette domain-containing protein [Cystobacter fuscus]EPX56109.1 Methionine ABC transporter ATP-binding protein [Cystobacter fuscus DSM 2262]
MIRLRNLVKTFSTAKGAERALDGVSLEISKGERFGIIGRSGAGKTTLLRTINLLERPEQGSVEIDGSDLTRLDEPALALARRDIGMVFQNFGLLSRRTVAGNVALPLELAGHSRADIVPRVRSLLARVGLKDKEEAWPSQLSGGQKQRVGIARALATSPKLLLCDEATSALDPETTTQILELLRELNEELGLTIVFVTHEGDVVRRLADQVAVMEGGRIVEQGRVFDIFTRPLSKTARSFAAELGASPIPEALRFEAKSRSGLGAATLITLAVPDESAHEALVSELVRRFELNVDVVAGRIEHIQGRRWGSLSLLASGEPERMGAAIHFLRERRIGVEVLGHVAGDA